MLLFAGEDRHGHGDRQAAVVGDRHGITSWLFLARRHVEVLAQDGGVHARDLHSPAGFLVNGRHIVHESVADAYVDLPPNPAGEGILAEIQFLALASGTSPLVLSNVFLNLSTQGFEIENGQITVTGPTPPAVPEPATLVLMTSGLALCAQYRVRRRSNHQSDAEARS